MCMLSMVRVTCVCDPSGIQVLYVRASHASNDLCAPSGLAEWSDDVGAIVHAAFVLLPIASPSGGSPSDTGSDHLQVSFRHITLKENSIIVRLSLMFFANVGLAEIL